MISICRACGKQGTNVPYDLGMDSHTGFRDAGFYCSVCGSCNDFDMVEERHEYWDEHAADLDPREPFERGGFGVD